VEVEKALSFNGRAYGVEAVVDEVLEVLAHADLSHQLVLVTVHARQLAHVGKDVLDPVGQLESNIALLLDNLRTGKSHQHSLTMHG
jgi:hypothetical protein